MKWDVIVVGGGPAGLITAREIAKRGFKVLVIEEDKEIGVPTKCAGLVSWRIGKIPRELIINEVKEAVFRCGDASFRVKGKKRMKVIDRKGYDKYRAQEAIEAGAKILLNTRFLARRGKKLRTNRGIHEGRLVVGADGPFSRVAKEFHISQPPNLYYAMQCRMKGEFREDEVELWFGKNISKGGFGYIVPEDEKNARVGVITTENPRHYFFNFVKIFGRRYSDVFGDVIRFGLIKSSVNENCLLVGDAAAQVKPFSGGGLIYGKICAEIAGKACTKSLEMGEEKLLKKFYDEVWKKEIGTAISKGMILRNLFHLFTSPIFFKMFEVIGIPKIVEENVDVDLL